jgi:2-amino-4-hydroxy-6-hydroxymethyldihydropteridine diphosphokinase
MAASEVPFYLGLGSNIGQRDIYLAQAMTELHGHPDVRIENWSPIYETDPVGYTDQQRFLNMVACGRTSLYPLELLGVVSATERKLGRERSVRWGPRTIDIDILLYNHLSLNTDKLVIPHPRMRERSFVMIPLADLAPNYIFPDGTLSVQEESSALEREGVNKWTHEMTFVAGAFGVSAK